MIRSTYKPSANGQILIKFGKWILLSSGIVLKVSARGEI